MKIVEDAVDPNEGRITDEMVQKMLEHQIKRHKVGTVAKRFLHGKSLGTVNAIFSINELPKELQVGLFAYQKEYRAVVRFSNGTFSAKTPDILPNVRGMAVKLLEVPGRKLLTGEEASQELDLILANDPTFFARTIEDMGLLVKGKFLESVLKDPGTLMRALAAAHKFVPGLLDIDYFSQVPYKFGDRACKFSFTRSDDQKSHFPNVLDRDYLRHGLEKHLRADQGSFTFNVQFQRPGDSLSDSTKRWTGPMIPLAELTLLQTNREIKESDGEHLSYNPFRTLAEHEPLSWPGRVRKAIYDADFKWRQEVNFEEQQTKAA